MCEFLHGSQVNVLELAFATCKASSTACTSVPDPLADNQLQRFQPLTHAMTASAASRRAHIMIKRPPRSASRRKRDLSGARPAQPALAARRGPPRACTKTRLAQMQVWPALRKAEETMPAAAASTSASSKTM